MNGNTEVHLAMAEDLWTMLLKCNQVDDGVSADLRHYASDNSHDVREYSAIPTPYAGVRFALRYSLRCLVGSSDRAEKLEEMMHECGESVAYCLAKLNEEEMYEAQNDL